MEFAGGGDILQLINKRKPSKYFDEKIIWKYFI